MSLPWKRRGRQVAHTGRCAGAALVVLCPRSPYWLRLAEVGGERCGSQEWFPALRGRAGRQAGTSSRIAVCLSHTASKVAVCPGAEKSAEGCLLSSFLSVS